jgi:hypothetical protein
MKTITLDFLAIIKIQGQLAAAIAAHDRELKLPISSAVLRDFHEQEKAECENLLKQLQEADKNGRSVY